MRQRVLVVLLMAVLCVSGKSSCTPVPIPGGDGVPPPELILCPLTITIIPPATGYELSVQWLVYEVNNNSSCLQGTTCFITRGTINLNEITLHKNCRLRITVQKGDGGSSSIDLSLDYPTVDLSTTIGAGIVLTN